MHERRQSLRRTKNTPLVYVYFYAFRDVHQSFFYSSYDSFPPLFEEEEEERGGGSEIMWVHVDKQAGGSI